MLDTPGLTFQPELLSIRYNCPLHDKVRISEQRKKKHKPTNVRRIPRERQVMQSNLGTVFQEEKQISLGW